MLLDNQESVIVLADKKEKENNRQVIYNNKNPECPKKSWKSYMFR